MVWLLLPIFPLLCPCLNPPAQLVSVCACPGPGARGLREGPQWPQPRGGRHQQHRASGALSWLSQQRDPTSSGPPGWCWEEDRCWMRHCRTRPRGGGTAQTMGLVIRARAARTLRVRLQGGPRLVPSYFEVSGHGFGPGGPHVCVSAALPEWCVDLGLRYLCAC